MLLLDGQEKLINGWFLLLQCQCLSVDCAGYLVVEGLVIHVGEVRAAPGVAKNFQSAACPRLEVHVGFPDSAGDVSQRPAWVRYQPGQGSRGWRLAQLAFLLGRWREDATKRLAREIIFVSVRKGEDFLVTWIAL